MTLVRRSSQRRHPGVCADLFVAFALTHHVQIAETTYRSSLLRDAKETTEKLGPLKVVLAAIPAAYENDEVRWQPPSRKLLLMNIFPGICRYWEQN